jgi:sulfur-oxidizing protein SoxY
MVVTASKLERDRELVSRRLVLTGAAALGATCLTPMIAAAADEQNTPQFTDAYQRLVGDRDVKPMMVTLEMPELAENGNMVPFTVAVESPMTEADYVQTITLFSTANPQPVIATFQLTPWSGKAVVSGRMRLARTQDVLAVAQLSSGVVVSAQTNVKVTVGGCGAG